MTYDGGEGALRTFVDFRPKYRVGPGYGCLPFSGKEASIKQHLQPFYQFMMGELEPDNYLEQLGNSVFNAVSAIDTLHSVFPAEYVRGFEMRKRGDGERTAVAKMTETLADRLQQEAVEIEEGLAKWRRDFALGSREAVRQMPARTLAIMDQLLTFREEFTALQDWGTCMRDRGYLDIPTVHFAVPDEALVDEFTAALAAFEAAPAWVA